MPLPAGLSSAIRYRFPGVLEEVLNLQHAIVMASIKLCLILEHIANFLLAKIKFK